MTLRRLVVTTALAVSLPMQIAQAQPAAGDPVDDAAAVPPVDTPVPPPTAPPQSAPREPEFKGRGLLISAIAVTAFSWTSRFIGMGTGLALPNSCDLEDCNLALIRTSAAFTFMAPIAQVIATGLVIPGGILKGRHDGWRYVTSGKPDRNGKAFLVAGAVVFGVFTATSVALRPAVLLGCIGSPRECGGRGAYAGYMVGVQVSDTLSTAGAGLMSYGIAYHNYRKSNAPRVSLAPWSGQGTYGLMVDGRF
jgi:hypothetical protein